MLCMCQPSRHRSSPPSAPSSLTAVRLVMGPLMMLTRLSMTPPASPITDCSRRSTRCSGVRAVGLLTSPPTCNSDEHFQAKSAAWAYHEHQQHIHLNLSSLASAGPWAILCYKRPGFQGMCREIRVPMTLCARCVSRCRRIVTFRGELVPALTRTVNSCVRFSIRLCKTQAGQARWHCLMLACQPTPVCKKLCIHVFTSAAAGAVPRE